MADKVLGKLTKAQFYFWRYHVEAMKHAETLAKLEEKTMVIMQKEQELTQLRVAIFRNKVQVAQNLAKDAQKSYHKAREEIEKTLGFSIKDTIIDEVSFEVKEIKE